MASKIKMEDVIDLFLSSSFQPLKLKTTAVAQIQFEAEMIDDEEDEKLNDPDYISVGSGQTDSRRLQAIGQELASLGDDFYSTSQARANANVSTVEDMLQAVFINLVKVKEENLSESELKEKEEKAWSDFKDIINNSFTDSGTDVGHWLGGFLLCLNKLSHYGPTALDYLRHFSLRFMQRELRPETTQQINQLLNPDDELD